MTADVMLEAAVREEAEYWQACFGKELEEVDPATAELIRLEEERQARKIILIPSESIAPTAVLQALGSAFNNVYAEGYPAPRMATCPEELLLDFSYQLADYRRYADRRFYKGVEYVDLIECLARRRVAECFATDQVSADEIYVNIQALSGTAANLAVYEAFMEPGETLMGMALPQGGHLTHGSPFNISGRRYKVVSYGVRRATERLDYDEIMQLAREHRPKIIVAGYTSYSWAPDWRKFREIADACGALLMADIAHTAGMVIAGVYPNPVGYADIITFTTHKTICGPRGAVIMTTDPDKAELIDASVFPGEQGGPHVNKFAAMAVAFKIAQTEPFRRLQERIVENANALSEALQRRGIKVAYGGTDTHIVVIDLNAIPTPTGFPLKGEPAARILDLCGIVTNKNTIPGDESAADASGIRLGTPWVSQRGMGPAEMDRIAELIHRVLTNIHPFSYIGLTGDLYRGKIDLDVLEEVKRAVAELAASAHAQTSSRGTGYPHYFWLPVRPEISTDNRPGVLEISGQRPTPLLQQACTANLSGMRPGDARRTFMLDRDGRLIDDVVVQRLEDDRWGRERYLMATHPEARERVKAWLRGLADGYVLFDNDDVFRKVEGPAIVEDVTDEVDAGVLAKLQARTGWLLHDHPAPGTDALTLYRSGHRDLFHLTKPYFVGQASLAPVRPKVTKTEFHFEQPEGELRRTPLYEEHRKLTRRLIPFAGWEMPVWYTSISDEHQAVRTAAGLFDVGHMGVLEVSGEHATSFLDVVTTNYVHWLKDGQTQYTYLLDPDGHVIDDLIIYRRSADRYMLVVNAANAEKDWAWLNAVNSGEVLIDREHPEKTVEGQAVLRNLKDPSSGDDQRIDMALQGPNSLRILQSLTDDPALRTRLARIRRTEFIEAELAGIPLIIARTGYTGEDIGYELFVHPDQAVELWRLLLEHGEPFGIKPAGLGARDSTRTEAGLPLYGHELAGPYEISPIEAGFGSYVKLHKPFFIGRQAMLERLANWKMQVIRFRLNERGGRAIRQGDAVVDRRGEFIGHVTSCTVVDGYQIGMAYVDRRSAQEGTEIHIFPLSREREVAAEKRKSELELGDRVLLPEKATIVTRFPLRKRRVGRPPEE